VEETDRKILGLLAADGRMSFTDLGKATGLSTSAVHQRVKRLEQRGLIKGYGATIDHEQAGLPLTAFISITPIDPSAPDDYPDRLRDIAEIESCWSVAGEESYILKVRVGTPADVISQDNFGKVLVPYRHADPDHLAWALRQCDGRATLVARMAKCFACDGAVGGVNGVESGARVQAGPSHGTFGTRGTDWGSPLTRTCCPQVASAMAGHRNDAAKNRIEPGIQAIGSNGPQAYSPRLKIPGGTASRISHQVQATVAARRASMPGSSVRPA
jgi:Lrp/AsnC family transcriptional regulator, leucine-responsive regulatory protein